MKFVSITQAKKGFYTLVEEAKLGKNIIITKYGKPVSQLVPYVKPQRQIRSTKKKA